MTPGGLSAEEALHKEVTYDVYHELRQTQLMLNKTASAFPAEGSSIQNKWIGWAHYGDWSVIAYGNSPAEALDGVVEKMRVCLGSLV